jgi:hypothetical protein
MGLIMTKRFLVPCWPKQVARGPLTSIPIYYWRRQIMGGLGGEAHHR